MVQSGLDGQMSSIFLRGTNSNHTHNYTVNGIAIKKGAFYIWVVQMI